MIPFNHPHDSEQAGLRDYRARVEDAWDWPPAMNTAPSWYRCGLLIAVVAIVALLGFVVSGVVR